MQRCNYSDRLQSTWQPHVPRRSGRRSTAPNPSGHLPRRITAGQGAFTPEWARPDARGHRGRLRGGRCPARRRRRPRPQPLLRRDPPRAAARLRRPGRPTRGSRAVCEACSARTTNRGARLRRALPGAVNQPWHRDFPMPEETRATPAHVAGVQPHRRRHRRGHGPVRDRPRHPVGRRRRLRPRHVPAEDALPPLRGAGRTQVPAARRHLGPLGADHPPRHRNVSRPPRPVLVLGVDAPGAGNAAHHDMAVTGLLGGAARAGRAPPDLPGRRRARPDHRRSTPSRAWSWATPERRPAHPRNPRTREGIPRDHAPPGGGAPPGTAHHKHGPRYCCSPWPRCPPSAACSSATTPASSPAPCWTSGVTSTCPPAPRSGGQRHPRRRHDRGPRLRPAQRQARSPSGRGGPGAGVRRRCAGLGPRPRHGRPRRGPASSSAWPWVPRPTPSPSTSRRPPRPRSEGG